MIKAALFGLLAGFLISLIWLVVQFVLLSFSEDNTGGGAIPLGYMFMVLPACLATGTATGAIFGLALYVWGSFN